MSQSQTDSLTSKYRTNKLSYDQSATYRQDNFPRERLYSIYPPKLAAAKKESPLKAFNIDSIELKRNLMVSNLPLTEKARMQKYNIYCSPKNYAIMTSAPKYIFDTFHFTFENNGLLYDKTHYFAVAPTLYTGNKGDLPVIYRFSVCREVGNPEHFSFNLYAIVGGYEDGFYFISRLDNNDEKCSHKVTNPYLKSSTAVNPSHLKPDNRFQVVPFPHIHRPRFTAEDRDKREVSHPYHISRLKNAGFTKCLEEFMKMYGISKEMILANQNCMIEKVIKIAQVHNMREILKTVSANDIEKFDLFNFENYSNISHTKDKVTEIPEQKLGSPYCRY